MADLAIGVILGPGVKLGNFLSSAVDLHIVAAVISGVVRLLHVRREKDQARQMATTRPDLTDGLLKDFHEELRALRTAWANKEDPQSPPDDLR